MTEHLEPLDKLADECLALDAEEKTYNYEYDDEDLMNATIVFSHIMTNRMIHNIQKTDLTREQGMKLAEMNGKSVKETIITMTGFDPAEYIKNLDETDNEAT